MSSNKKITSGKKKSIEALQKQVNEYLAGWQRCKADFENYKRQQQEWTDNFRLFAKEDILQEIVPVIDNFELAMKHAPENLEIKSWIEGIAHIKKQLEEILARNNVQKIEVKNGDLFNPKIHECVSEPIKEGETALANGNSENQKNNLIVKEVLQNGYLLGKKILRPAKVNLIISFKKND